MTAPRYRLQRRAVLATGLLLRLLVAGIILLSYPRNWLYTRGMEMGLLAKSLLAGQGLGSPFGGSTGPTAFIAPGYPLIIAGIFRIFGVYSFASVLVVLALQIAINGVTLWLGMQVAQELFDPAVAVVCGWIWACSFPLLWLPTIFWDTSISICALTGFFCLALWMRRKPARGQWLWMGAACGLLGLLNPALLPTLLGVMAWTAWQTWSRYRSGFLLALLIAALIYAPWPLRNARVFHALVATRTTVGFELWMGNRPGSTGFLDESVFPMFNQSELADYKRMGEIAYTAHKSQLAKDYIKNHRARFAELTLRRIGRFWMGRGTQGGSWLFVAHSTIESALGLAGLGLLFRRRRRADALLFVVLVLIFPIPYYMTHAEFRYRLIIDPEMAVLTAYALVSLYRYLPQAAEMRQAVEMCKGSEQIHGED